MFRYEQEKNDLEKRVFAMRGGDSRSESMKSSQYNDSDQQSQQLPPSSNNVPEWDNLRAESN